MQIYSVFEQPGGNAGEAARLADPGHGVIFIKEGFCWPALAWPMLWALYHRMWRASGLYILISLGIAGLGEWLGGGPPVAIAAAIGLALIAATEANRIRGMHLARNGYLQVASVAADNLAQAELRYFSDRLQPRPPVSAPAGAPRAPLPAPRPDWGFMAPGAGWRSPGG